MHFKYILLLTLIWSSINCPSQTIQYKHDEAPNMIKEIITTIYESNNHVLYLGTNGGIELYDGSNFHMLIYPDTNNHYVASILEQKNKIYYSTWSGLYSYFNNKLTKEIPSSDFNLIKNLCSSKDGNSIFYSIKNKVYHYRTSIKSKPILIDSINTNEKITSITKCNHEIIIGSTQGIYKTQQLKKLLLINSTNSKNIIEINQNFFASVGDNNIICLDSTARLVNQIKYRNDIENTDSKTFATKSGNQLVVYTSSAKHMVYDENNIINRLYLIDVFNKNNHFYEFTLPKDILEINTVYASQTNIWLGSYYGLYTIKKNELNNTSVFKEIKSNIINLSNINGDIICLDDELNNWNQTYPNFNNFIQRLKENQINTITSLCKDSNENYFASTINDGIVYWNNNELKNQNLEETYYLCAKHNPSNNFTYFGTSNGIIVWNGSKFLNSIKDVNLENNFIYDVAFMNNDILIASSKGFYVHDLNSNKTSPILQKQANNKFEFNNICIDKKNRIWLASDFDGVYLIEKDHDQYHYTKKINKENGLTGNNINFISCDSKNRIWLSSDFGVNLLSYENEMLCINDVLSTFPFKDKIKKEIRISVDKYDSVWITCKKGFTKIYALNYSLKNENKTKNILTNIIVNEQEINWSDLNYLTDHYGIPQNLKLNHKQNTLEFDYTSIDFDDELIYFQYYVEGYDKTWNSPTSEKKTIYKNLPFGHYTFHLRNRKDGIWSEELLYSFEIKTPWWRTWAFYLLLSLAFTFVLIKYLLYRKNKLAKKYTQINEELTLKNQLLQLESASLLNQLKPHFIFNALAPIQKFLLTNQNEKALQYLDSFSNLMRHKLLYAREDRILISDEIKFLTEYIDVRQIEKRNSFTYKILNHCKNDFKICSLVIQPIIENTINHGFSKTELGELNIEFSQTEPSLITVIIKENGIGFNLEVELNKQKNNALNIIFQKLSIFKKLFSNDKIGICAYHENNQFIIQLNLPIKN